MSKKEAVNIQQDNNENSYIGFGIGIGLLCGTVFSTIFGIFLGFPWIWFFGPGLGMLIGISIGSIMDSNKK